MPATQTTPQALAAGAQLEEFEILSVIGAGGFGIVYQAFDHSLQRRIALKEYMPCQFAYRAGGKTVVPSTSAAAETFGIGLRSFINEARLLAQFDHPALIKVHRFWEDNGTAYMAMPFYEGLTLKQTIFQMGASPGEAWLRALLDPLLEACATLHAASCLHRDIAPDNILLTSGGPVLLDFGAARRVITDATKALTVILKEGYAPIEQYGRSSELTQGPWTDIYSLCGVLRFAITGEPPPPSVERLIADRMPPLREAYAGQYGDTFLRAIDAGLAVAPQDRPQDIAQLRGLLGSPAEAAGMPPEAATILRLPEPQGSVAPDLADAAAPGARAPLPSRPMWIALACAGIGLASVASYLVFVRVDRHVAEVISQPAAASPAAANGAQANPAQASPEPANTAPPRPSSVADQRAALAEEQSSEALLARARTLLTENGGSADAVLADALASQSAGTGMLAAGDASGASGRFREAAAETRRAVHGFLDEQISSYSGIARRKVHGGDLELAQRAIEKVKTLRQAQTDFD